MMTTHALFCTTCGKPFLPDDKSTHWLRFERCEKCIATPLLINGKFCKACGKPIPYINRIRKNRKGELITIETRSGIKYCRECVGGNNTYGNKKIRTAHCAAAIRWQRSNKDKAKAESLARYHLDKLVILYECPCDAEKKHNHHHDYERPLEVIRLCHSCHIKEHKRLRSLTSEAV